MRCMLRQVAHAWILNQVCELIRLGELDAAQERIFDSYYTWRDCGFQDDAVELRAQEARLALHAIISEERARRLRQEAVERRMDERLGFAVQRWLARAQAGG